MRGILRSAVAAGLLFTLCAVGLHAQAKVVLGIGGGAIFPMSKSDYQVGTTGPAVKSVGYNAQVMVGVLPSNGIVSVRVDGQYAALKHELLSGTIYPKTKFTGGNLDIVVHPGKKDAAVRPYIMGGGSLFNTKYRASGIADSSF